MAPPPPRPRARAGLPRPDLQHLGRYHLLSRETDPEAFVSEEEAAERAAQALVTMNRIDALQARDRPKATSRAADGEYGSDVESAAPGPEPEDEDDSDYAPSPKRRKKRSSKPRPKRNGKARAVDTPAEEVSAMVHDLFVTVVKDATASLDAHS